MNDIDNMEQLAKENQEIYSKKQTKKKKENDDDFFNKILYEQQVQKVTIKTNKMNFEKVITEKQGLDLIKYIVGMQENDDREV